MTLLTLMFTIFPLLYARSMPIEKSLFVYVIVVTTFYYAVIGRLYWEHSNQGYFSGVNWSEELAVSSLLFGIASFIAVTAYFLTVNFRLGSYGRSFGRTKKKGDWVPSRPILNAILIFVAFVSCVFVYIDNSSRGGLFLIAYQVSDIFVAILIFSYLRGRGSRYQFWLFLCFFFVYCVFVGFRYKLIILFFPLYVCYLVDSSKVKRISVGLFLPLMAVVIFAVIGLLRVKFSGLDVTRLSQFETSDILYGFFSDTNILFGVCSIIQYVIPRNELVGFEPVFDIARELVPRFLLPDKQTGSYLYLVLQGLQSDSALHSATAFPFFGEYLLMFGYPGLYVGSMIFGIIVALFVKKNSEICGGRFKLGGAALIAVLFGYFYVTRGYMPAFSKTLIFVLLPYWYLAKGTVSKARVDGL